MCMIYGLLLLYLCVCMYPHIIEVKRVCGVYQYIFSCEESMCWVWIVWFSQQSGQHSVDPQMVSEGFRLDYDIETVMESHRFHQSFQIETSSLWRWWGSPKSSRRPVRWSILRGKKKRRWNSVITYPVDIWKELEVRQRWHSGHHQEFGDQRWRRRTTWMDNVLSMFRLCQKVSS